VFSPLFFSDSAISISGRDVFVNELESLFSANTTSVLNGILR